MSLTFEEWFNTNAKYMHTADFEAWLFTAWEAARDSLNKVEETLDEDEEDVVHYIEILEDSNGYLTWDSSYETLDEFMEVLHIVAKEVQEPVIISVPLH